MRALSGVEGLSIGWTAAGTRSAPECSRALDHGHSSAPSTRPARTRFCCATRSKGSGWWSVASEEYGTRGTEPLTRSGAGPHFAAQDLVHIGLVFAAP